MDKITGKMLSILVFLLAFYAVFVCGIAVQAHHWSDVGFYAIMGILWTFLGFNSLRLDRQSEQAHKDWLETKAKLDKSLENLLDDFKKMPDPADAPKSHNTYLEDTFAAVVEEVTDGEEPTTDEIERMQMLFHERTGHFARVTPGIGGATVEMSIMPFMPRPEQKTTRKYVKKGTKIPVTQEKPKAKRKYVRKTTKK